MSQTPLYWLALLILVPIVAYWVARRNRSRYIFCVTGVAFGAIVSPWAMGMYSFYFLSPWGVVPGIVGLLFVLTHGAPGFKLAVGFGLVPPGVVADTSPQFVIEIFNAIVWALVYGALGFGIDLWRRRKHPPQAVSPTA